MFEEKKEQVTENLVIKFKEGIDAFCEVTYENGALDNIYFSLDGYKFSLSARELVRFSTMWAWLQKELATRKFN